MLPLRSGPERLQFFDELRQRLAVIDELEDLVEGLLGTTLGALEEVHEAIAILSNAVVRSDAVFQLLLMQHKSLVPAQRRRRFKVALQEDVHAFGC